MITEAMISDAIMDVIDGGDPLRQGWINYEWELYAFDVDTANRQRLDFRDEVLKRIRLKVAMRATEHLENRD